MLTMTNGDIFTIRFTGTGDDLKSLINNKSLENIVENYEDEKYAKLYEDAEDIDRSYYESLEEYDHE